MNSADKDGGHETGLNRLAGEKSPYLLQHARQPVLWYPWGDEAIEKARREDKPVFLSVGYSACHWCHVMARESFDDPEIAGILNGHYVSVKVDREERPDIDHLYMTAVQALTGSGGWPLTVFLTPDLRPFFGGTYFSPDDRFGRIGMRRLLEHMARLWREDRERIEQAGRDLGSHLAGLLASGMPGETDESAARRAFGEFLSRYDRRNGGFGGAPKFPRPCDLSFLLRYAVRNGDAQALEMAVTTLRRMARGGLRDHLGGGFHRYSVDEEWKIPHFEKMLYDQALLARAYLEGYQAAGDPYFADVAAEIFDYVGKYLTDPGGAFYSAEDADTEGWEGKFYVWRPEEILKILGEETGRLVCEFYGVLPAPNFENGTSVLRISESPESFAAARKLDPAVFRQTVERAKKELFDARGGRTPPAKDDKILASWNGLMISSLALGAEVLADNTYAERAAKAADFILGRMRQGQKLFRRYREAETAVEAFLDDYIFLAAGLLDLYEATFDPGWMEESKRLLDEAVRVFRDPADGGFFSAAPAHRTPLVRGKDYDEGVLPSGNSAAAHLLARFALVTGDPSLGEMALSAVRSNGGAVSRYPSAYPFMLIADDFLRGPACRIVLAGERGGTGISDLRKPLRKVFLPARALLLHPEGNEAKRIEQMADDVKNLRTVSGRAAAYVCFGRECGLPVTDGGALEALVRRQVKPGS